MNKKHMASDRFPITDVSIEVCLPKHLPQILEIYNHYVHHTVITFDTETQPLSWITEKLDSVLEQEHLPFLVAVQPGSANTVVGYAYATQFRLRRAYAGSVEMTIYLRPSYKRKGLGRLMLDQLMERLRAIPKTAERVNGACEVLAISAIDPEDDVRDFYLKAGFVEAGCLRKVGWKFGKWWDTSYMQYSLRDESEQ